MIFETASNNIQTKKTLLSYDPEFFYTKKTLTENEIKSLYFQSPAIFELIITKMNLNQINDLILKINTYYDKKKTTIYFLKIIYYISDDLFYKIFSKFTVLNPEFFFTYPFTSRMVSVRKMIPIIFRNRLHNLIIKDKQNKNTKNFKIFKNHVNLFLKFYNNCNKFIQKIKKKLIRTSYIFFNTSELKKNLNKIIGDITILCLNVNKDDYLQYLYANCNCCTSLYSLHTIKIIFSINKKHLLSLYKHNTKFRKTIHKFKYKLYYLILNTDLKNFISLDKYDILLSYNYKEIDLLIKNITFDDFKNIDWSFVNKQTITENKPKMISVLKRFSLQFPKYNLIYQLINTIPFQINLKKDLIDFTIENGLPFNFQTFIEKSIQSDKCNISLIKNYISNINTLQFDLFCDKLNSLLDYYTGYFDNEEITDYDYKKFNLKKSLVKISDIVAKNNISITIENKTQVTQLFKRLIHFLKNVKNYNTQSIKIIFNNLSLFKLLLKQHLYSITEDAIKNETCLICCDKLTTESGCHLHCNHYYHKECIKMYLTTDVKDYEFKCPYCTQSIFS